VSKYSNSFSISKIDCCKRFLVAGSSISMGGIAVWSMHFIGNRAIVLGDGQAAIQLSYSARSTVLSLLTPIIALFLAFSAVGSSGTATLTQIAVSSALLAISICVMHYLGQAGISNYTCVYYVAYVVGAGITAFMASVVAFMIFFIFQSAWYSAKWKRALVAAVLTSAVSGMHWIASIGTEYRLKPSGGSAGFSETYAVIAVLIFVGSIPLLWMMC
jgi:NO-binding membrane sensor protein with MHYT domain